MFYLVKILIGRAVSSLDRTFDYYSFDESLSLGMRVIVSFGPSKETVGFILENPIQINEDIEEYQNKQKIKLAQIIKKVDDFPLLDERMINLAKTISSYYHCELIRVLSSMLPPSMKPKNSALDKTQGKFADYVFALKKDTSYLKKNELALYEKIVKEEDGIKKSEITAKKSLENLLSSAFVEIRKIPVSRIPEIEAKKLPVFSLTNSQEVAYNNFLNTDKKISLLKGVTGSGKTEIYIKLADKYLKEGKGVIILVPEIALTDQISLRFAARFKESISILHSSLSNSRKYDEYKRIINGESKIVLGTRSAIFAPVKDLSLIIIDEEHSRTYKQDNIPYYNAIKVAQMRSEIEDVKVLLGSATPAINDMAKAKNNLYNLIELNNRFALNQDRDLEIINMSDSKMLDPMKSSLMSRKLLDEIKINLDKKEQTMILINRRGYAPIYVCRNCHSTAKCPNCSIPLNYHKRMSILKCHHCGYIIPSSNYTCTCSSKDFLTLGYGTERTYEELKSIFPSAKIHRIDSDISSNEVRHEILSDFSSGDSDILIGTEIIAKGHDFPRVTLAAILDADSSLRIPSYLANEDTFDLISQFVGRCGRGSKKGRVILQTYIPDNEVISLASKQNYDEFYLYEMEERRKYKYPPYTYLCEIIVKGLDKNKTEQAANNIKQYLLDSVKGLRFDIIGPSAPYIPFINNRHIRNILIKYKSKEEADKILDGIKLLRIGNKDVEILINVDPDDSSF